MNKSELDRLNEQVVATKPAGRIAFTTAKVRAHVGALMLRSRLNVVHDRLYKICGVG